MYDFIQIVGAIAGVGGLSLGLSFLLFRDFLTQVLENSTNLTENSAYKLLSRLMAFFFLLALVGLLSWVFLEFDKQRLDAETTRANVEQQSERLASLESIVNRLEKARYPNVEELRSSTVLDLTGWKPVPLKLRRTEKVSEARWTTTTTVRKPYEEVASYFDDYGTSGLEPEIWCSSHEYSVTPNIEEHHIGADNLARWLIDIDISAEAADAEFDIVHHATFFNSFQGITSEWAETMAHYPGAAMQFTIIFPEGKECDTYALYSYPYSEGADPELVDAPDAVLHDGGRRLVWKIGPGRLNYIYRAEWTW